MNITKLLLATLAATIAIIIADSIWFLVLLKPFFASHAPKYEHEIEWMHLIGELFFAFMIALLYPMFNKNGNTVSRGAVFGMLMGLAAAGPSGGHMMAEMGGEFFLPFVLLLSSVFSGIAAGITTAWVYERKKPSSS